MPRRLSAEQLDVIYRSIGAAVWHLQFLEDVLVTCVTMRLRLRPPVASDAAKRVLAEERQKTLGRLLSDAKGARIVEGSMADAFAILVGERNWLIHRSMHEFNDDLYAGMSIDKFVLRVHELKEKAIDLKGRLYGDTRNWCVTQGIDVEAAEAMAVARLPHTGDDDDDELPFA